MRYLIYCAFHNYANSKIQKPPSQLRFSLPWAVLRISSDRDNRRSLGGLKFSISGFFWAFKVMFLFFVLYHFMLSGNSCYGSEIRHEIFWGINFGPGIFLGFDFCPHSIIPVTWNPEYPLWAWVKLKTCIRTLNFSHFPSQVNLCFSDWKLVGGEQWKNQTFLKP